MVCFFWSLGRVGAVRCVAVVDWGMGIGGCGVLDKTETRTQLLQQNSNDSDGGPEVGSRKKVVVDDGAVQTCTVFESWWYGDAASAARTCFGKGTSWDLLPLSHKLRQDEAHRNPFSLQGETDYTVAVAVPSDGVDGGGETTRTRGEKGTSFLLRLHKVIAEARLWCVKRRELEQILWQVCS